MNSNSLPSPSGARAQRIHAADSSSSAIANEAEPVDKHSNAHDAATYFSVTFALDAAKEHDTPLPLGCARVWFSRSRLFELRSAGKIDLVTVGGRVCIRPSELRRYIESLAGCPKAARKPKGAMITFPAAQSDPRAGA